jgi:hypothetical protein
MKIIEIQEWEPSDIKTIELTQDMGNTSYQLKVRKFVPVKGDSLERKWNTNGEQRSYRCANYAIVNMEETGQQMLKFVEDNITTAISFYIDDKDELLRETYGMAYKHSEIAEASSASIPLSYMLIRLNEKREEERILLRSVLKLWVAVRMESRSERICGPEHLGMVPQTFDQAAKNYNQVLVPPVMSAQVELIMTAVVLQPLKKSVLTQLQELIKANRSQSWFTIYLCLFVLLHSCALLTSFENMQAKKYGLQVYPPHSSQLDMLLLTYYKSRYVYDTFIEELHNGSKIMLAYFHYCNKGSHPFAMDWTIERNIRQAELKPEQLEFLVRTTQLVKERGTRQYPIQPFRKLI